MQKHPIGMPTVDEAFRAEERRKEMKQQRAEAAAEIVGTIEQAEAANYKEIDATTRQMGGVDHTRRMAGLEVEQPRQSAADRFRAQVAQERQQSREQER
ncbi:hypothetical protein [Acetobacter orientalis]|nr:hypothetical protein [Acetobacter orientalis]